MVRLIQSIDEPDTVASARDEFHRQLVVGLGQRLIIRGKYAHERITKWLEARGVATIDSACTSWVTTVTVNEVLEPLESGAFPYLAACDSATLATAARATRARLAESGIDADKRLEAIGSLRLLISRIEVLAGQRAGKAGPPH